MLKEVYYFLKNPVYQKDENTAIHYRLTVFAKLLFLGLAFGIGIVVFNTIWESFGIVDPNEHALSKAMDEMGLPLLGLMAIIAAPLFEEFIFRGPLVFFKNSKYFKLALYTSIILFGAVHISNFEITPTILILAPFLVAPQLVLGAFASFIRIKFGLGWSILLHACHNLLLFMPLLAAKLLDIPLE